MNYTKKNEEAYKFENLIFVKGYFWGVVMK